MEGPDATSESRISYVIGPDGMIIETFEKVKSATHAEDVLATLDARKP